MKLGPFLIFFFLYFSLTAQQTVGLFLNDSTATPGYTLFGNNKITYLIDNCGLVVNSWKSDYKPGESMYLLENGNLLRTAQLESSFDAGGVGGRFELFSWEGDLLWSYQYASEELQAHHDIAPLPNGNFLFTAWEKHSEAEAKAMGRVPDGPVWSERIVELEPLGRDEARIVWQWRLWDHLVQDQDPAKPNFGAIHTHPGSVNINYLGEEAETSGNWVHLNAIDYNAALDQIAVSSRLFSEIWIIDHNTTTEEASGSKGDLLYRYGNPQAYGRGTGTDQRFFHQHDAHWVPDDYPFGGSLMVFNNEAENAQSGVELWTPPLSPTGDYLLEGENSFGPQNVDWAYTAPDFYSRYMSGAHVLPNGHVFICEGMKGRFFEINPDKEIVWEYINPVNANGGPVAQGGTVRFNQTFRATKYPIAFPAFQGRNLIPGKPVEINPWETDCFIPDTDTVRAIQASDIKILGNPVKDQIVIEADIGSQELSLKIIDMIGVVKKKQTIHGGQNHIYINDLPAGIFFLAFSAGSDIFYTFKIVLL